MFGIIVGCLVGGILLVAYASDRQAKKRRDSSARTAGAHSHLANAAVGEALTRNAMGSFDDC